MMFGHGYSMGWTWVWFLLAVVGLLLFIFVIVRVAIGGVTRTDGSMKRSKVSGDVATLTPLQILDERYAKGELTTKQYRERVSVLRESASEDGL